MRLSVAGGFYRERCVSPDVDDAYGSGGRAAIALALGGAQVDWHYYCPEKAQDGARLQVTHQGLSHHPTDCPDQIRFRYFHPLSKPTFTPTEITQSPMINIEDDLVLRFGFMEGGAVVNAKTCVYDPQSPSAAVPFSENGSTAERLAITLNAQEVLVYGESDIEDKAVMQIFQKDGADVVLVKAGADGCRIYEDGKLTGTAPPYWSTKVYKIGTGDVFSAAFTYHWALKKQTPSEAADAASRCVARYCENRTPTVEVDTTGQSLTPVCQNQKGQVYIAGPFFTIAELWLIEEAYAAFHELGVTPFSPYHHIGLGPPEKVVGLDIKGLKESSAVFAVLDGCDPGTIFEIGYAVRHGLPVVALSQNPKKADHTMLLGSPNCTITDDFATAIYRASWEARK